jgi:hypothetical protein
VSHSAACQISIIHLRRSKILSPLPSSIQAGTNFASVHAKLQTGKPRSSNRHHGKGNSETSGLRFSPNVFSLSDRDTPAAILRKQKSLNMTFSATLLPASGSLGYLQSIGISAYLSEFQHQDTGIRGCVNQTGMCFYSTLLMNGTSVVRELPFWPDFVHMYIK